MELDVKNIAELVGGSFYGDGTLKISGVADLAGAKNTDISFILSPKNIEQAKKSAAKAIISDSAAGIEGKTVVKVDSVKPAYAKLLKKFYPPVKPAPGISKTAVVAETASVADSAHVGENAVVMDGAVLMEGSVVSAGCFIGRNCRVGKNTFINANATVYDGTAIGDRVIIHSGTVIGADGFGFAEDRGKVIKLPQVGAVRIGNEVEIGANCTIDRAAFGETVIENFVKLDNLVQVAHNCIIGEGTMIAAQSAVAGSTVIGKYCIVGGQVGIADHLKIGNMVKIGSQTGVGKDIKDNEIISGTPARPLMKLRRAEAHVNKLEEFFKKVKWIEEKLKEEK